MTSRIHPCLLGSMVAVLVISNLMCRRSRALDSDALSSNDGDVIADEPRTAGLAPGSAEWIRGLLRAIGNGGSAQAVAVLTGGHLQKTESERSWEIYLASPGVALLVTGANPIAPLNNALVVFDSPLNLKLGSLTHVLGPYQRSRDGKTASATFVQNGSKGRIVATVRLLSGSPHADALVTGITIFVVAADSGM